MTIDATVVFTAMRGVPATQETSFTESSPAYRREATLCFVHAVREANTGNDISLKVVDRDTYYPCVDCLKERGW